MAGWRNLGDGYEELIATVSCTRSLTIGYSKVLRPRFEVVVSRDRHILSYYILTSLCLDGAFIEKYTAPYDFSINKTGHQNPFLPFFEHIFMISIAKQLKQKITTNLHL